MFTKLNSKCLELTIVLFTVSFHSGFYCYNFLLKVYFENVSKLFLLCIEILTVYLVIINSAKYDGQSVCLYVSTV